MRACSTASGGVMFIPEMIVRKPKAPKSYEDMLQPKAPTYDRPGLFGSRKVGWFRKKTNRDAA